MDIARARLPLLVGALVLAGCATTAKPVVSYPDAAPPPAPPPLSASLPPPVAVPALLPVPPPTPEEPPVTGAVPTPPSALRRTLRTPPRPAAAERPATPAAPAGPAHAGAPAAPTPSASQVASVPPAPVPAAPPVAAVTPSPTVPVLAPQLSAEEEDRLTQKARSQIEGAEKVLGQIEKSRLRRTEQSTLATVLDFLAKAREAMAGRDYQRAATLADKARVLAEDLTRAVR